MKQENLLSFTMGCEADPTSRVKVISDGKIIRVEGISNEGEAFTIDFELPLEGLRQFQQNVEPFLTSDDDVDLENPYNYDWTLKYKTGGMEMSTSGIVTSENVFKDMKVNILRTLYEVQQKYDYAMKNGAELKELVDLIEEKTE